MARRLVVHLGPRSYPILVGRSVWGALSAELKRRSALGARCAVVADASMAHHWMGAISQALPGVTMIPVPSGEVSKSAAELTIIWDMMARGGVARDGCLFALGGGVVGDLAGFAAATYLRGIDYWQVPTTLLAMVDSAVGGKTAINLGAGKNLAGAIHQPRAVQIGMEFLSTLPRREFLSGMAEVLKYGLLGDPSLWRSLAHRPLLQAGDSRLGTTIRRCCTLKARIVSRDELETAREGGRLLLNLGHTFAHAIEAVAGYGTYLHGEAVALGLVAAARLSAGLDLISPAAAASVEKVVAAHELPVRLRDPLPAVTLRATMASDKKARGGRLRFIVLRRLGAAAVSDGVPETLLAETLAGIGAN